jgi:hypothetical protein
LTVGAKPAAMEMWQLLTKTSSIGFGSLEQSCSNEFNVDAN